MSIRRRFLCGGCLLFSAVLVVSWVVAGQLVAPVPRHLGPPPADLGAESITLESDSGARIAAWHVRTTGSRGVVVLVHGIRASRLALIERARFLVQAGYSVVMIDLSAHGESTGQQITLGLNEQSDVVAAVACAREQHPDEPVALIGISLGGAAALLGSPLEIDALVLESVFPDITAAVCNRCCASLGPLGIFPGWLLLAQLKPRLGVSPSQLCPIDHIGRAGCPVMVLSGSHDNHTTIEETEWLFAAAREPKELWIVPGAAHVDLHQSAPEEYERRVLAFVAQSFATPRRQEARDESADGDGSR